MSEETISAGLQDEPALVQAVHWDIDYRVHVGAAWSRFFRGLEQKEILGTTCAYCDRTYVPPQAFCESCFEPIETWRPVDHTGVLAAATVVYQGFEGGPVAPYAVGAVKLDGTDSLLMHFIRGVDLSSPTEARATLRAGLRVQAIWADDRSATILDLSHFVPISGE